VSHVAVMGGGPAGLMAAEVLAQAGLRVSVFEAKPSAGRKFLMAGKSGLNLTKDEEPAKFLTQYAEAQAPLCKIIDAFGPADVQTWARDLGQEIFTGSTGRVFPRAMKASPLMRAWMGRLAGLGVTLHTRSRWIGWEGANAKVETGSETRLVAADAFVLALGGASWARLGSDGIWADIFSLQGIPVRPFRPANVGAHCSWSDHMARHAGTALKGVAWRAGDLTSRGEAVISAQGLEGGGIYEVSRGFRDGAPLVVDLLPDLTVAQVEQRIARPIGKRSMSNHLRKVLQLDAAKIALAQEFVRPLPQVPLLLAQHLKAVQIVHQGTSPIDQAISTAGGVPFSALTEGLMLRERPGVFCAGEMLDWEAPTGGYLITACLATGRWAGLAALDHLQKSSQAPLA